ncbi:MAG: hypothetical protein LUG95_01510, partial [Clostridiales bacterium]|nr:hypothetical protein [Clostridiales bacterium]
WNDVENANGYEVYTLSSDTYTLVADTEVSSYTSSSLTSGTAYDFSVRAYTYNESREKIYSAYSDALSCATNPTKVKIVSLETSSTSSVKIKWSKVDCTGYQIEYATDKKFKKNEKNNQNQEQIYIKLNNIQIKNRQDLLPPCQIICKMRQQILLRRMVVLRQSENLQF